MALDIRIDAAAVCVVEMQNDLVAESNVGAQGIGGALAERVRSRGVVPKLRSVLAAARPRGVPVFYLNVSNKPGFPKPSTRLHRLGAKRSILVEGTSGCEVHSALRPEPGDYVLERCVSVDPSYGTQLYPILRMLRRTTMIVAGVSTNFAVEGLVRGSVNRGFDVVVVEDACASAPEDWHRFSVENILPLLATVTDAETVTQCLAGPAS